MGTKKIIVLGTASQVPSTNRNHIAVFIRWDEEDILIDPGEGTQRQMIRFGVPINKIKKILITHFHGDHCLGLPGVIQRLSLNKVKHPIEIFYPKQGEVFLHNLINSAIFHNNLELIFKPIEDDGEIPCNGQIKIHAFKLDHGVETFGYKISDPTRWNIIPTKLPIDFKKELIGELKKNKFIEYKGQKIYLHEVAVSKKSQVIGYCLDTKVCENAYKIAKDVDILICESTYLSQDEELALNYKHLTATQAATIAKDANANKLILLHYSQRYPNHQLFEEEAKKIHENVSAAFDGMEIDLPHIKREIDKT